MKKDNEKEAMTTYLISFKNGKEQKITVPDHWKVTFGPSVKGNNWGTDGQRLQMPMALRFYESEHKQRAIFTDVVGFRDLSIIIEEKRIDVKEKHGFMECDGTRKATTFQASTTSWVDPDKEGNLDLPALPSDTEMFTLDSSPKRR